MTEFQMTGASSAPAIEGDRLDGLISRVAGGDRAAFRCLYAFMAMRVWHIAMAARLSRADAVAVVRSTFVEVWHVAGAAFRYDARDWMTAVASVRVNDRLSVLDVDARRANPVGAAESAGRQHRRPDVADHDAHIHRELTALLGTAGATVRTGPGQFTRIANLNDAPTAIATTRGRLRWAGARRKRGNNAMYINKVEIVSVLRSRGLHDRADWVERELPNLVDTGKNAALLKMLGVDSAALPPAQVAWPG